MPLSLHIALGNARRVAGMKDQQSYQPRIGVLRPHCGLKLLLEHGPRYQPYEAAPGDASPSPRRLKNDHHRVIDNEKFRL